MDAPDPSFLPDGGNGASDYRPDCCPRCQARPYPMHAACRSCGLELDTRLDHWREMDNRHSLSVWSGVTEIVVCLLAIGLTVVLLA